MNPRQIGKKQGPEKVIELAIRAALTLKGWYVIKTHGNEFQFGLPDLYCCHARYGQRWIEVKNPLAHSFTPSQKEVFHKMAAHGVGVWVLMSASEDELAKLFNPPQWFMFI